MTDAAVSVSPSLQATAAWPRTGPLVGLVAVVLTAILGWMVWDRVSLLRNGREIVLPVTPVDPRSLFRGDYVILGYDISQVPAPAIANGSAPKPGQKFYVTLERGADGAWKPVETAIVHPGASAGDRIVLQGRLDQHTWRRPRTAEPLRLRYGIESFFLPEDTGRDLEALVRDKKIAARIAVDSKGRVAIKGLLVDGKALHDEPLL